MTRLCKDYFRYRSRDTLGGISEPRSRVVLFANWNWRIRQIRNGLLSFLNGLSNRSRGVRNPYKMCPRCRLLMDRNESVCSQCGYRFSLSERSLTVKILRMLGFAGRGPTAVHVIVGLNLVIYAVGLLLTGKPALEPGVGIFGVLGMSDEVSIRMGVLSHLDLVQRREYWRVIASCFLHAGILHLVFNMMVLSQVGPTAEYLLGRARFVVLYFAAGVSGFVIGLPPQGYTLGASGAVFGVVGSLIAYGFMRNDPQGRAMVKSLLHWVVIVLVMGAFIGGVNNMAHIGGGIAGALTVFLGGIGSIRKEPSFTIWRILQGLCILATIAAFGFMAHNVVISAR